MKKRRPGEAGLPQGLPQFEGRPKPVTSPVEGEDEAWVHHPANRPKHDGWGISGVKMPIEDLTPTHIVYDGDDEVYRGAWSEVVKYLANQREKLIESQVHIAPIETEVDVPVKSERASDFVIFEGDDEEETDPKS